MNKKVPLFLLGKDFNLASVLFSLFFGILFINIYTPFSSFAWFELSPSMYFLASLCVVVVASVIIVLSRLIMCLMQKRWRLSYFHYALWLFAEIVVIAVLYTAIAVAIRPDVFVWMIFRKAFLYTFLTLVIPYSLSVLYATLMDRNKRLKALQNHRPSLAATEANEDTKANELIHLKDNNGILRLSLRWENLYYIESQDNYVKVHYFNKDEYVSYMLRCKLKTIEDSYLGTSLMRCHRSYIINASKVRIMRKEKDGLVVDMDNQRIKSIPVSRSYAKEVLKYFSKNEGFEGYQNNARHAVRQESE